MPINETQEQRDREALVIRAVARYLCVDLRQLEPLSPVDALSDYGHAIETKGRMPPYTPKKIEELGGIFVEEAKYDALSKHPMGFFVPYFIEPEVAFLIHHSLIKKGKRKKMDRTRAKRGQDDRDVGWNVSLKGKLTIRRWNEGAEKLHVP